MSKENLLGPQCPQTQEVLKREPAAKIRWEPFHPEPDSMWLVVVECQYNVIRVSADGKGFFIPGQEPCWHFSHVREWISEIDPMNYVSIFEL